MRNTMFALVILVLAACGGGDDVSPDATARSDARATTDAYVCVSSGCGLTYCHDDCGNYDQACCCQVTGCGYADCEDNCGGYDVDCCAPECGPTSPNECAGETICIAEECVNAFGRIYIASIANVHVHTTNGDGDSWDAVGGAPDPYGVLWLSDSAFLTTTADQDTFDPTFSENVEILFPAGSKFGMGLLDEDISDDDWIIYCELDPLTANYLRAGGITCSDGTTTMTAYLSPKG